MRKSVLLPALAVAGGIVGLLVRPGLPGQRV